MVERPEAIPRGLQLDIRTEDEYRLVYDLLVSRGWKEMLEPWLDYMIDSSFARLATLGCSPTETEVNRGRIDILRQLRHELPKRLREWELSRGKEDERPAVDPLGGHPYEDYEDAE